ncbi:MAG: uroporphyrinogen-III C-methyltransferase [Vicinamibacterales bacterium]|nr:uroporphyrinogen-III C-methyltransferase [Vicinamibacterales bacterium]MDP6608984.1 uroporphyrinogen-III C-methyltransferase [Vicinamibacterales bacterium]
MRVPRVFIVGAGPGDPSLITVRGLRRLSEADVVVHDHLVPPRLLRLAPADAEMIDVGAAAISESLEQDAVSILIAEKAREHRTVVRLKWGDPFVFDSGAKEALFLHEQGVPFEVVPGIPATIGAPAYAGVPITYPDAGDTLVLVRGHEDETDAPPDVDWKSLAHLTGTIACYVGTQQLHGIVEALLKHGRPGDESAAVIYHGTQPGQRTVDGTLQELEAVVRDADEHGSAVLIVGSAVGLRAHLRWFDTRPLFGRRIVVTRAAEQAGDLVEQLADLGAEPIEAAAVQVVPPVDLDPLDDACERIDTFDWVVFTSANGVEYFLRRLVAGRGDIRNLKGVRLCAVGPATGERLTRHGIKVDLMPDEHLAEAVAAALQAKDDLTGKRVLLPRADLAREVLPRALEAAGAVVESVTAYRTVFESLGQPGKPDIYKMLLERQIDAVTFASASTVRSFAQQLGAEQVADLLRTTVIATIGPVTAEAAKQLNIRTDIMPSSYTIPALVDALVEHFSRETDTED